MKLYTIFAILVVSCAYNSLPDINSYELPLDLISLPEGFSIDIYAYPVPNARSMTLGPDGIIFVGTRTAGNVYMITDKDHDNRADEIKTIVSGWNSPNGVAYKDGDLYVAEINRIWKFENILDDIKPEIMNDNYPSDRHHGWKFIRFGPDDKLYVPVGAPCNICNRGDPYAAITRIDGSDFEIYARGVRNTVGFDWHPETNELWFTDNGRDWFGEDIPPDELNHAPKRGMNFGYPYCHGNLQDDEFIDKTCDEFIAPKTELGPHVAALGMRFYTGEIPRYKNKIFIAEHGSWNRKIPIGYRITLVDPENPENFEIFAEGWLQNGKSWGRPVDIEILPDGSLLVSDDKADAIYRISYQK